MAELRIAGQDTTLPLRGRNVLDTLLRAGIAAPHGCRSGCCGSCKARLLTGDVELDPYDEAALSGDERARGLILTCRARARGDVTIDWLDADFVAFPVRSMVARVVAIERVAAAITRLRLEPEHDALAFAAGQWAELRFGAMTPRPFSMANRPGEPFLEFHLRLRPGGLASEYVAKILRVGEPVRLRGPFGAAHLRLRPERPILAAAGGTGAAPIGSIVADALARGWRAPIRLYVGARVAAELYALPALADLARRHPQLTVRAVLSEGDGTGAYRTGFLHEAIAADRPALDGHTVYAAGPPPMVAAVQALAVRLGAAPHDVHSDPFVPAAAEPAADAGTARREGLLARLLGAMARRRGAAAAQS